MKIGSVVVEKMIIKSMWSGGGGCAGYVVGVGGLFCQKILQVCGPSCKLKVARFSAEMKFQDGPSVSICWL